MHAIKSKDKIKTLIITSLFNTLIAVVLSYMVMEKEAFFDVFVISQCIGLSICFFVNMSLSIHPLSHRCNRHSHQFQQSP